MGILNKKVVGEETQKIEVKKIEQEDAEIISPQNNETEEIFEEEDKQVFPTVISENQFINLKLDELNNKLETILELLKK